MRPWTYVAVPGYEILSLESERDTRRIAMEIQRAGRFMPFFFPSSQAPRAEVDSVLFIDRNNNGKTLTQAREQLKIPGKIDAYTVSGPGFATQFASADLVAGWLAGRASPVAVRFTGATHLTRPGQPQWYRDGVFDLLGNAKLTDTRLELPARRWNTSTLMPLPDLLAVKTQGQAIAMANASAAERVRFRAAAVLFVRWGLFSDAGIRRNAFLEFVAAGGAATEADLQRYFGFGLADQQRSMLAYAAAGGQRLAVLTLPRTPLPPPLVPLDVRPATETEVARIVGGSYLSLARQANVSGANRARYLALARETLDAVDVDRHDLRFLAMHSVLEFEEEHDGAALADVKAALAGGLKTPFLHYLDAALRMRRPGLRPGREQALPEADEAAALASLHSSLMLSPHILEAYRLLAEIHLQREQSPSDEDLALLATGVREFPDALAYLANVALLHDRAGRLEVVRDLVTRGLDLPGVEQTPQHATLLGLRKNLEAAGLPAAR